MQIIAMTFRSWINKQAVGFSQKTFQCFCLNDIIFFTSNNKSECGIKEVVWLKPIYINS